MGMQKPKVKFRGRVIGKFPTVEPNEVTQPNHNAIPKQENVTTEKRQVKSEPLSISNLDHMLQYRLYELATRNIAIKIYPRS
jgi:hypothetical protein